jgi:hypothetical protein
MVQRENSVDGAGEPSGLGRGNKPNPPDRGDVPYPTGKVVAFPPPYSVLLHFLHPLAHVRD